MIPDETARLSDGDLVELVRRGSDRALAELLGRYRPMVRSRSRRFYLQGADRADVTQEGMIGLYKAIRDFSPQRGHEFGAFAQRCITRQIISAVRGAQRMKHQPLNHSVPIDSPDGDGDRWWGSTADDPAGHVVARMHAETLARWCESHLSPLERTVLEGQLAGDSYAEIARRTGLSGKGVDNAVQRLRRKLQRHLHSLEASAA